MQLDPWPPNLHRKFHHFDGHYPLHRQAQMLGRQGMTQDRSTLANSVGRACWWLQPLYELMVSTVLSAPKVFADDTMLPVLEPGRGRTKTEQLLWCYAVDDRAWHGPCHPVSAYSYSEARKAKRPEGHLAGFTGVLQVDGYAGFKRLAGDRGDGSVTWRSAGPTCGAGSTTSGPPPKRHWRQRCSRAFANSMQLRPRFAATLPSTEDECATSEVGQLWTHIWLHQHIDRVSAISDLAEAMRYAIRQWPGLVVFLDDGRVEKDTNVVERAIRPSVLTRNVRSRDPDGTLHGIVVEDDRQKSLFAGSDGGARHWALAMTLIQTAKLNGVDPMG